MPVMSTYGQRPPFNQAWQSPLMYSNGMSPSMGIDSEVPFMYGTYSYPQLSSQQPMMPPLSTRNYRADMSEQAMEYRRSCEMQGKLSQFQAEPHPGHHMSGKILPAPLFSVNDNRGESGGSTSVLHTVGSGNGYSNPAAMSQLLAPHTAYFHPSIAVGPSWRHQSVLSPFGDVPPNMPEGAVRGVTPFVSPHNSLAITLSKPEIRSLTRHRSRKGLSSVVCSGRGKMRIRRIPKSGLWPSCVWKPVSYPRMLELMFTHKSVLLRGDF